MMAGLVPEDGLIHQIFLSRALPTHPKYVLAIIPGSRLHDYSCVILSAAAFGLFLARATEDREPAALRLSPR